MRTMRLLAPIASAALLLSPAVLQAQETTPLGVFRGHGDVGRPSTIGAGAARFDPATRTYAVTGGGANMWATADHFHYVWIKVSGDAALEATVAFTGTAPSSDRPDPHRKACLLIRQTLDADSPYADAATHGDGLTSLQWRDAKGALTHEVQANIVGPTRLRLEKRGEYVSMSVARGDEPLRPAGGAAKLRLTGDYYIGLAVSAHDSTRLETATFSDVSLSKLAPLAGRTTLINTLETISLRSKDRRTVYVARQPQRIEAPTWFPDSTNMLYFTTRGRLFRVQADLPGRPANPNRLAVPAEVRLGQPAGVGPARGVARDGSRWALSATPARPGSRGPHLYIVPASGGAPTLVSSRGPATFGGWSPDGAHVLFSSERRGNVDVYLAPASGGSETRLTTAPARDANPELSPDGQHVYFNSDRSGRMQIWRMRPNGSMQEQVTGDAFENWHPHVSPDGRSLVFLSYEPGGARNRINRDVRLRRMALSTRAVDELATLVGGQGTIDAASWSPDSQYLAFVSYQVVPD